MTITDELLYRYAPQARNLWLTALPGREEDVPHHVFSPRFQRRMAPLLRRQRRSPALRAALLYARRAAVLALVFLTVSFSCLTTVNASFRAQVIRVVTELLQDFTHFSYSSSSPAEEKPGNFTLTYLPEGMKELEREVGATHCYLYFENEEGQYIMLDQDLIDADTVMEQYIDTEDAVVTHFVLRGANAMSVEKELDHSLLWAEGNLLYFITGTAPTAELILMAEGLKYL